MPVAERRERVGGGVLGGGRINLHVDAVYTERLASFFRGLGQTVVVAGPGELELIVPGRGAHGAEARTELEIYLRVWRVIYPDAPVELDPPSPPATE
jgi:hypothetical protein